MGNETSLTKWNMFSTAQNWMSKMLRESVYEQWLLLLVFEILTPYRMSSLSEEPI